ncbi:MAG TPA: helix-turn-helix domain-containing protein [Solirubrobacter sp.]|nr:helix-turn-helix domain-containing protein [Solirubrobacter sp.]
MSTLTPDAADALRRTLPSLADEIVAAIARDVPAYARPMEGRFGETVRFGVQVALNRFVDLLVGDAAVTSAGGTYKRLGAGEYRQGRTLDALLNAYRVGARVAWRRFVEAGQRADFPPDALYDLGEAMFAYIDEISAESAAGFAEAQSEAAGESQRRRRRVVRLLVQEPPAEPEAVRAAAQAATWTLPRTLAAVVVGEGGQEDALDSTAARLARGLGPGAIGAAVGVLAVVLMPDPEGPGRRHALETALDERAALGPAVPWTEAGTSLRRAEAAFELAASGKLDLDGRLVVADEHLPALLLTAAPGIGADLARTRLAPLDGLARGPRERLVQTLRAWLDRPGQVQAVAEALDVHPQTVRYRLKQLRELFGERLDDPEARFELSLALRALRYS